MQRIRAFGSWWLQPHQDPLWTYLEDGGLRAAAVWHRRGGKDDVALRWTFKASQRRVGNYWHMLPQASQARKAIWEALNPHTGMRRIDEAFPPAARKRTNHNEMLIEFMNGSIWQVVGSDNYNALVGSPPVGITFSEWALADPHAWAYMRPILRENGGWAIFIYTPRGRNHGHTLFEAAKRTPGWFAQIVPASQSDVFTPAELEEERQEYINEYGEELGQNLFDQEYGCSFDAAILGAIYARWMRTLELKGRIGTVAYDPALPVNTAWDIGYSDTMVCWFWQIAPGAEVHLIDYYQAMGKDAQHYCEMLAGRKLKLTTGADGSKRVLPRDHLPAHMHRQHYKYGKHYAPHDAAHKTLAGGGRSVGDLFYDYGYRLDIVPAVSQATQISAARKTLEHCWFDKAKCQKGIDALQSYRYEWSEELKMLKDAPLHDWSSHACDGFEIIGQVWQPLAGDKTPPRPRFLHEVTADEVFFPKDRTPGRPDRI